MRDRKDILTGCKCNYPVDKTTGKPCLHHARLVGWAHLYPTTRIDEVRFLPPAWSYIYTLSYKHKWLGRLSDKERSDVGIVQLYLKLLNEPSNGLTILDDFPCNLTQYCGGIDVDVCSTSFSQFSPLTRAGQDDFQVINFDNNSYGHSGEQHLMLDHISNLKDFPSMELLRKQFRLCLYRSFFGEGNLYIADFNRHTQILKDYRFSVDLLYKCWLSGPGKEALKLHLAWRLSGLLLSSLVDNEVVGIWSESADMEESTAMKQSKAWPVKFDDPSRFTSFKGFQEKKDQDQLIWKLAPKIIPSDWDFNLMCVVRVTIHTLRYST